MKSQVCFVTTSWDDGHPSDFRIAEALARFDVPGTFYIPAASHFRCIGPSEVRTLSERFDIGAHTLRHRRLTELGREQGVEEIAGSKDYIEQCTGRVCRTFAPPGGRFRREHMEDAGRCGLIGFRTTELMSLDGPRNRGAIAEMATTLQVFEHGAAAYWKNAVRRGRPGNLARYWHCRGARGLERMFAAVLDEAIQTGGTVHLWGHGWEIEATRGWAVLDRMLKQIAERRKEVRLVDNAELCSKDRVDEATRVTH